MSQLLPALDAELRGVSPTVFGAIAIDLPGYDLRLLDGAGILTINGQTFVGQDDTFGTLSEIEDLTDGTGDSAPALGITLLPASDAASAALASPLMQGAPVVISLGAVNPATGQPVGTHTVFIGELDVPTLHSAANTRRLDYEVVSVFERLFEDDESARLSPGHHRSIFPNEAGMDFVTGVDQPVFWGVAGNPSPITTGASAASVSYFAANKF
jgi:hypothetical protein